MELASSAGQIEAGGFFCQQGALGGVSAWPGLQGAIWNGAMSNVANLCKRYKMVSTTGTDKYITKIAKIDK